MEEKAKYTVLIVEDTVINVDILIETLDDLYEIVVATDGQTALNIMQENIPDIVLLDIMMSGMDGYEVCKRMKANKLTEHVPVIFLTALSEEGNEAIGLGLGAVDYMTKPFSPSLVKARIHNHLQLKLYQDDLEEMVKKRSQELLLTQEVTIESLASLAEYRDPETGGHIQRTKNYVKALALHLKEQPKFKNLLNDNIIEQLFISAPLHDIGKVGVKDSILLKPGKLTAEEFDEMKKHTSFGQKAIAIVEKKLGHDSFLTVAAEIASTHHERWDGSGYPLGLKGEDIPLSGRIMAIADVYDALISKRVYKEGMSHEKAVEIILHGDAKSDAGHFDPDILKVFKEIQDEFYDISQQFKD